MLLNYGEFDLRIILFLLEKLAFFESGVTVCFLSNYARYINKLVTKLHWRNTYVVDANGGDSVVKVTQENHFKT